MEIEKEEKEEGEERGIKRIQTKVGKELHEDQERCKELFVFADFKVDTDHVWNIMDIIAESEDAVEALGVVYRHAIGFRPMIIMILRPDPENNDPGCYSVYSMESRQNTNQEEGEYFRFDLVEGENIGEKMTQLLMEIDERYINWMLALDANLIEFTQMRMLQFIAGVDMKRKAPIKVKRSLSPRPHKEIILFDEEEDEEEENDDDRM